MARVGDKELYGEERMGITRGKWLLSLLGVGLLQGQDKWRGCLTPQWSATCKASNGQCPVCGTQASEKYVREVIPELSECLPNKRDMTVTCKVSRISKDEEFRVIRCVNCNCAFYQDAEEL